MATKAWFDYGTYMANKLAQMQETYPNEKWTAASLQKAFEDAGFVGDEGAFKHFQKYGHKEDVSPNKYFDADYYYQSKAIQYYGQEAHGGLSKAEVEANMATYAKNMEGAIKAAGMDAWTHYIKYGTAEGVNPSNSFDTSDYMAAKLAALQAAEPSANWDEASMNAAFKKAGLNALEHFMQYAGKGDNEVTSTDISDFEVPDSEKIDGGNAGDTFTLTTAADTLTGTAKDDSFVAGEVNGQKTLTAGDNLDGGDGTDTLTVSSSAGNASYAGFTAKNIEVLEATSDGDSQTFDLSGTTDLTTLRSINSSADVTFNHVATLANVEATKLTEDANAAKPNITVQYENAAVTGSEDAVSFTLNSSNVGVVKLGSVADDNGGIESLALTATGGNSTVDQINSDITTLTFTGDKNVKVDAALNTTVKTIDASAATGGLSVEVAGNNVTFTGGAGNDEIDFGASLNASDKVTGGEGTDRLVAEKTGLINASAKVSGVEIIRVSDQLTGSSTSSTATDTLNAGAYADATTFELAGGYDGARINDFTASQTRVDILSANNNGTLTLDEASTEFTLGVGQTGTEANVVANVTFANNKVATLNVESNGTKADGAGNGLTVTSTALTTVNITGAEDLVLTTAGNSVTTVAAGEATGDLDLRDVGLSTKGAKITTGSGDDVVKGSSGNDAITTGAGVDLVLGSAGIDTITLGDGADVVRYTNIEQSNSVSMDTIKDFVNGSDKLDVTGLFVKTYAGTKSSFDLAQGALTKGTRSAVFDSSTGRFWVDMDADGTLSDSDFRVVLEGVSTVDERSIVGVGTEPVTVVAEQDNTGIDGVDTLFVATKDVIQTAKTTVTGNEDTEDTLQITSQIDDNVNFSTDDHKLTSIEKIILDAGTDTANNKTITVHNEAGVEVTANAAAMVILGKGAGQVFNGSGEADTVTLGAAGQTVNAGAGNDAISAKIAQLSGSTINGGAGDDTLTLLDGGDISNTTATLNSIEMLAITAATTMTTSQFSSFTKGVTGAFAVTFSDGGTAKAGSDTTTVGYTFSDTATTLDLTGVTAAGAWDVQGGAGADVIKTTADVWGTGKFNNAGTDANDKLVLTYDTDGVAAFATLKAKVGEVDVTGTNAGANITFAEATDTGVSTVDLTGYKASATISMGDLATGEQTINARNGFADALKTSTAPADASGAGANDQVIVNTSLNIDDGDTVTLGDSSKGTNYTAGPLSTVKIRVADNGDDTTTTTATLNTGNFEFVKGSLNIGVDGVSIANLAADRASFQKGLVNACFEETTAGSHNGTIYIDVNGDGGIGAEDVTINVTGLTSHDVSISTIANGGLDVVIS